MTTYTKYYIAGSEVDVETCTVRKSLADINSINNFRATFDNYKGGSSTAFNVGDEVVIYSDRNTLIQPCSGPMLQYTFNDGSGISVVDGISGNNATIISGGEWIQGKLNSGLFLGSPAFAQFVLGSDYVWQGNDFSYTIWFNGSGVQTGDTRQIFGKDRAISTSNIEAQINSAGKIQIYVTSNNYTNDTAVTYNQWNHLAVVREGGSVSTYLNGTLDSPFPQIMTGSITVANLMNIGQDIQLSSEPANMYADDFRIYNYALSENDVQSIYNKDNGTELINCSGQKLFLGIVENIDLRGRGLEEDLTLSGRDYSVRMVDRTVEPEAYNNLTAGSIVKDIIAKYTDDITTNNVDDGDVIERIVFNHKPVFDAVTQLAESTGFQFYVDNDKDLHFKEKSTTSSNLTFGSENIWKTSFKDRRDEVYNEVWVYGDRYLDAYQEQFEAGGTGSIFTLLYNPSNTTVTLGSGITTTIPIQPGGIYNQTVTAGSELKYLVNYEDKQIIFTSGTDVGDNIPKAGSQVTVDYMRDLPIVKVGENDSSIETYGRRVKVIQDKNIKDPITAELFMLRELEEFSEPTKEGKIDVLGVDSVVPGETCVVNIPIYGINNVTYDMIEAKYNFNKDTELNDKILQVKLNRKIPDVTDTIKDILLQLKEIQSADMQTSDLLTRYKTSTGSQGMRQSGAQIWTRTLTGSVMIWGSSNYGTWGTDKWGTEGSAFNSYILQWSGGYF